MQDPFALQTEAFVQWFRNQNATLSEKVQLSDLRYQHQGRGLGNGIHTVNFVDPF